MATYTQAQKARIDYFRASVRLQDPQTETDPVYQFTDDDLWGILTVVTPSHNANYTIDTIPDNEFNFAVLLGKKEIYYRLATSTAPFYPLSAEGASLQKNARFDHYMSLLKQTDDDYKSSLEAFKNNYFGTIQTYEVRTQAEYFSLRNYNLAERPQVAISISGITQNSLNVDWTKFDTSRGNLFLKYDLYIDSKPIVDEYAYYPIQPSTVPLYTFFDINRLKYRLDNLQPDTPYYVCIVARDRNGWYGYSEQLVRTLPLS